MQKGYHKRWPFCFLYLLFYAELHPMILLLVALSSQYLLQYFFNTTDTSFYFSATGIGLMFLLFAALLQPVN